MNRQTRIAVAFGLLLLLVRSGLAQSPSSDSVTTAIRIAATVEQTKIPLNRLLRLHVTLSWQGDPSLYEIENFDNPALTNLEIIGTATTNRSEVRGGKTWVFRDYEYTLKPRELGMGYVEGVVVKCRNTRTDREETLVTQRIPVEVVDPVPEPGQGPSVLWFVIPVVLVVLGGAGGAFLWRQRKRKREAEKEPPPPPVEVAYLEELKSAVDLKQPDLRGAFDRISKLLRRYLSEKYGIRAREATTAELKDLLAETGLEEHQIMGIQELLARCDEIKFSGMEGTVEELTRFYTAVESLLRTGMQKTEQTTEAA